MDTPTKTAKRAPDVTDKEKPSGTGKIPRSAILPRKALTGRQHAVIKSGIAAKALVLLIDHSDEEKPTPTLYYCPALRLYEEELHFLIQNRNIIWDNITREPWCEALEFTLNKIRHARCGKDCDAFSGKCRDGEKNREEREDENLDIPVLFVVRVDYS